MKIACLKGEDLYNPFLKDREFFDGVKIGLFENPEIIKKMLKDVCINGEYHRYSPSYYGIFPIIQLTDEEIKLFKTGDLRKGYEIIDLNVAENQTEEWYIERENNLLIRCKPLGQYEKISGSIEEYLNNYLNKIQEKYLSTNVEPTIGDDNSEPLFNFSSSYMSPQNKLLALYEAGIPTIINSSDISKVEAFLYSCGGKVENMSPCDPNEVNLYDSKYKDYKIFIPYFHLLSMDRQIETIYALGINPNMLLAGDFSKLKEEISQTLAVVVPKIGFTTFLKNIVDYRTESSTINFDCFEENVDFALFSFLTSYEAIETSDYERLLLETNTYHMSPYKLAMACDALEKTGNARILETIFGEELTNRFIRFINQKVPKEKSEILENLHTCMETRNDLDFKLLIAAIKSGLTTEEAEELREKIAILNSKFLSTFDYLYWLYTEGQIIKDNPKILKYQK